MNANDCTSLYRFYDEYETLLYVGITSRGYSRFDEHSGDKVWWKLTTSSKIEHFKTRPEAQVAERGAIQKEKPAFNEKMAGDWKRNIDAYYGAREDRLRRELSAAPEVPALESWAPPAEPEDYGYSKYRLGYTDNAQTPKPATVSRANPRGCRLIPPPLHPPGEVCEDCGKRAAIALHIKDDKEGCDSLSPSVDLVARCGFCYAANHFSRWPEFGMEYTIAEFGAVLGVGEDRICDYIETQQLFDKGHWDDELRQFKIRECDAREFIDFAINRSAAAGFVL